MDMYRSRVYDYDWENSCVLPSSLPWPAIWLLGRTHRKHVWARPSIPPADVLRRDLLNFVARTKFRYEFRDSEFRPPFRMSKADRVDYGGIVVGAELDKWLWGFRSTVASAFASARQIPEISGRPYLVRVALRAIRSARVICLPHDKEGGFSTLDVAAFHALEKSTLLSPRYEFVGPGQLAQAMRGVSSVALACAQGIAALDFVKGLENDAIRFLLAPLRRGSGIVAQLNLQCKSHKGAGSVKCRPLHCCRKYGLEGLAKWLALEIRGVLARDAPHLLKDSLHVKRCVVGQQWPSKFCKIDIPCTLR